MRNVFFPRWVAISLNTTNSYTDSTVIFKNQLNMGKLKNQLHQNVSMVGRERKKTKLQWRYYVPVFITPCFYYVSAKLISSNLDQELFDKNCNITQVFSKIYSTTIDVITGWDSLKKKLWSDHISFQSNTSSDQTQFRPLSQFLWFWTESQTLWLNDVWSEVILVCCGLIRGLFLLCYSLISVSLVWDLNLGFPSLLDLSGVSPVGHVNLYPLQLTGSSLCVLWFYAKSGAQYNYVNLFTEEEDGTRVDPISDNQALIPVSDEVFKLRPFFGGGDRVEM